MGLPKVQRVFVRKNGPKSPYHQGKKTEAAIFRHYVPTSGLVYEGNVMFF